MPDNLYPPFSSDSGALTIPRQLDRWLDINPQGGSLRRCQTFVTLPSFNTGTSFISVSQIVASFNVEGPNAITLSGIVPPTNPNYVLCISYRVQGVLTRYVVWQATGSKMPQYPTYTGQVLLKNWRFEIWNTSQGFASDTNTYIFYTSKLQPIDYRFGTDAALVNLDPINTSFQSSSFLDFAFTLPMTFSPLSVSTTN